jgi:outer membrane protein TolC
MKPIIIIFLFTVSLATAAGIDSTSALPPLDTVLTAAVRHSPLLQRESASAEMYRQELGIAKKEWLRGITLEAASQYGSYGDQTANTLYLGNRIGATMKISLEDIFSRGNKTEKYEAAITMTEYNKAHLERELRQLVTAHYARTQTNIELVKITTIGVNNASIQKENAEIQFKSGEISLYEYTRIIELVTDASMKLERARGDMREEWMVLEQIVGVPLESLRGAL